jgi:predicted DNA-binding transcriptional regulator AlpA
MTTPAPPPPRHQLLQQLSPKSRALRVRDVRDLLSVSRTTLYEIRRTDPTFPLPVQVAPGTFRFLEHEVLAWLQSRQRVATVAADGDQS